MAVNDPTQQAAQPTGPDFSWLTQMAQQAVQQALVQGQQAITNNSAALESRISALEGQLADSLAKQAPAVEAQGIAAVTGVLMRVEEDPTTQRIVVCAVLGAALLGALIILVAALLGNDTATRWIAAAPALLAGAVLWISKAGVSLPKKAGPPAP